MVLKLANLNELWGYPNSSEGSGLNLDIPLGPVSTDSRKFGKGDFFVPLQGEKFDGHKFLQDVFDFGAQAAVVSRKCKYQIPSGFIHWIVDDTLEAYQQLGLLHRRELNIPVIAVTGSAGKTTTRELIKSSLSSLGDVLASDSNNNNDVGLPLTLLAANSSHCSIVVEMGMRGLGEIERLSIYSQPDIAVITYIGTAHIGRLGSRENIAKAKCEITSSLRSSGLVVIPAGDSLLENELSSSWNGRVVRVSLEKDELEQSDSDLNSTSCNLPTANIIGKFLPDRNLLLIGDHSFQIPLEGRHNAQNLLLAIAVARELGVPFSALETLEVDIPSGRHRCIRIGQVSFIDATYNSSPEAVQASLSVLVARPGRHFAVLGKMLELGEQSVALHRQIAEFAVSLGLDGLLIVDDGEEGDAMVLAASSINYLAVVSSPEEAFPLLSDWLESGDVVLLKASRAIGLEHLLTLFQGG